MKRVLTKEDYISRRVNLLGNKCFSVSLGDGWMKEKDLLCEAESAVHIKVLVQFSLSISSTVVQVFVPL